jgi:hypothetical protein
MLIFDSMHCSVVDEDDDKKETPRLNGPNNYDLNAIEIYMNTQTCIRNE